MRKYECIETSSFFDRNLRKINTFQDTIDIAIKEGVFRFHGLRQKLFFLLSYATHEKNARVSTKRRSYFNQGLL